MNITSLEAALQQDIQGTYKTHCLETLLQAQRQIEGAFRKPVLKIQAGRYINLLSALKASEQIIEKLHASYHGFVAFPESLFSEL